MRNLSSALAVLLSVTLLPARQEKLSCGTHPDRWREELHLHRQSENAGTKRIRKSAVPLAGERFVDGKSVRADIGNIAILDDSDGVVARRNAFNLNARTLRFVPLENATKYRYELAADTYDPAAATGSVVTLGDDDSSEVALPFPFPYFGGRWQSLFVNSDGNVTFGLGDVAATDRSLGRFIAGAPRIAALFRDLDPTRARTGGVFTSRAGEAFVVSWLQVPEYRDFGTGPLQTFQLRLFPDGKIEFAYSEISTSDAVVGISPGRVQGLATVVSFVNTPSGPGYTGAVAERFSGSEQIDIISAAQKFYLSHDDSYDYLVFYNNLNIPADDGAVAYEVTLRNNRTGFGDEIVDIGRDAGSPRRLQAIMNMGNLGQYPKGPDERVPARFSVGDTPITTLGHEAGHLFLAFASVNDDVDGRAMLGGQGSSHWAFTFNSEASLLEGNRIRDNGPGASPRFLTTATVEGFSPLDQYLMGLRAPDDVPDMFYVRNPRGTGSRGLPRVGVAFDGDRRDVRIDEIVSTMGRRTPDHTVAQRRFRFAFILVTSSGVQPTADEIAQLELWRERFEQFYLRATSERAVADTSLKEAVTLSLWPAAGVAAGATASARLTLSRPTQSPLTVLLRSESGNARFPASVVVPAGATEARFEWTGVRPGTDQLTAEPSDARYETAVSRVQVSAPEAMRLVVVSGDGQPATPGTALGDPVQFRVTDQNALPYASVPVSVSLTGGGTVDRTNAVTDENGVVSLRWTPGPGPLNELRAEIPGGASATATAPGRPSIAAEGVVNAASFAPGLTPGGIATAFGVNLVGADVLISGRPATVFYSGTRQVNFLVPQTTPVGTADILIRTRVGTSETVSTTVRAVQPGIFFDVATGYGAVTTAGTGQVTQVRPARAGEVVEVYSTGLGSTEVAPDGNRVTVARPVATVGQAAAEVLFSGLTPGFTGLYQINVRIPPGTPAGTATLSVSASGLRSNEVRIEVR